MNTGDHGKATVTVEIGQGFEQFQLYGEIKKELFLDAGETSDGIFIGLPQIYIDGERFPEAAKHIQDALSEPKIVTLDRDNRSIVDTRRLSNTNAYRRANGLANDVPQPSAAVESFQLDEAPPASVISEFGYRVRAILFLQNNNAGTDYRVMINNFGSDELKLPDGTEIEYYATEPVNSNTISGKYNEQNNIRVSNGKNLFTVELKRIEY